MKSLNILEQHATDDETLKTVKRIRVVIWVLSIVLAILTVTCIILAYALHAEKTATSTPQERTPQEQSTDTPPTETDSKVLSAEGEEFDFSDFAVTGDLAFYAESGEEEYLMICNGVTVDIVDAEAVRDGEEYTLLRDESGQPSGAVSVYYDQLADGTCVYVFKQYEVSCSTSELIFNIPVVMRYKCTSCFQYDMPTTDLQHITLE